MSAVYVDNLLAAVEDSLGTLLKQTARAMLHTIQSVFPLPWSTGVLDAKDPVSEKNLAKRDALYGENTMVQLPVDHAANLLKASFTVKS
jgi:hypothetical protein